MSEETEQAKRYRVYATDFGDFWVLHTLAESKVAALARFNQLFPNAAHLFRDGNVSVYLDSPRFRAQYQEGYFRYYCD